MWRDLAENRKNLQILSNPLFLIMVGARGFATAIHGCRPCGTVLRTSKNAPGVFVNLLFGSISLPNRKK